jgi:hypothetical protein
MSREKACQRVEKILSNLLPKNAEFKIDLSTKQIHATIFPFSDQGKGIQVKEAIKFSDRKPNQLVKNIKKSIYKQ